MARRQTKRDKLLVAIDVLFLKKGLDAVTISDVAVLAGVPLGNVYYYFKTKNSMIQEALRIRRSQLKNDLDNIERRTPNPKVQLQDFINLFLGFSEKKETPEEALAKSLDSGEESPSLGKFVTILLLDLEKHDNKEVSETFTPIVEYILSWCSSKFLEQGSSIPEAEAKASKFINTLVGACVFGFNRNVKAATEEAMLQYIQFIIKTFGIEDVNGNNVTSFSSWRK